MIFSRASEYAIQAMLYLAKREQLEGRTRIQTKEIAQAHSIPYHFLAKIVQDLAKSDLIQSLKGPTGGINLARSATDISIIEIVRSVENIQYLTDCVIGYARCNSETPCPLHFEWQKIRDTIFNLIRDKKLDDFLHNTEFASTGHLYCINPT